MRCSVKKIWISILLAALLAGLSACGSKPEESAGDSAQTESEDMEGDTMKITAGTHTFTAALADNSSAKALKELLAKEPLTIKMSDYACDLL